MTKLESNVDDTVLYYTAVTSSSKAAICKFAISESQTVCTQLSNMLFVQTLTFISSIKIFASTKWTSTHVGLTMIEWNNNIPSWTIRRN